MSGALPAVGFINNKNFSFIIVIWFSLMGVFSGYTGQLITKVIYQKDVARET